MPTRAVAALLTLAVTASALPAAAGPSQPTAAALADAERLVAEATRHFEAGRLTDALDAFRRAYALARDPKLLFAMAKLEIELGDCASALEHLRLFLDHEPGPRAAEAARRERASCPDAPPPTAPPAVPAPEPAAPTPAAAPAAAPSFRAPVVRPHVPWYEDNIGMGLTVSGGVVLATGGFLWAMSYRAKHATAHNPDEARDLEDEARGFGTAAWITGGIGAALVVGGIVRYATRDTGAPVDVAAAPTGDGWAVTAFGRF
jgi:tetratricopeptide (TPR) repeat protein